MPGRFVLICILLLVASSALADNGLSSSPVVAEIEIIGLKRTSPEVVEQELLFRTGENITQASLDESVQRLRNLRIFSEVSPTVEISDDGNAKLVSRFEEKWTTVPIMKFSSGGNARHIIIGTYDINAFGKYKEIGGQYENYSGKHSGVVWYRNPRFFKQRLLFGIDAWAVNRPYTLYQSDASVDQSFVLNRKKLNTFLEWELLPWIKLGTGFEFDRDELLEAESNANIANFTVSLGRTNYDNYLLKNGTAKLLIERGVPAGESAEDFLRITLDAQYFYRLPMYSNIAFRLRTGQTNATSVQHQFFVGGLENVRGYYDTQFLGKAFWQGNAEFRIPSYRNGWFVIQHIFFFDAAQTSSSYNNIADSDVYTSYGTGIRLISPKVYRLTARLDYAITNTATGASAISFGAQQFF